MEKVLNGLNRNPPQLAKRYSELKEASPVKYKEVIDNIRAMSEGADGGRIYIHGGGLQTVRGQYFKGWADSDFKEVLVILREIGPNDSKKNN